MKFVESQEMEREILIEDVQTKNDIVKTFETVVAAAKAKKDGSPVYLMVGPGERKIVLKRLREYLKMNFGHCGLENRLKVVQEESI